MLNQNYDMVYIHVEAPDEMGHQGSVEKKIQAIENLDSRVIKIVKDALDRSGEDYRILVMPDHPTPICVRTHTSNPVPYMLYDSTDKKEGTLDYNEKAGKESGLFMADGHEMMRYLMSK